ncbi:GNAT family N-acetyltransferase [Ilyomonas limi]|uniref:GNAT family N-acetyltransferase n=1 Tax=Ilyomonas limi TaxID=2575867 RepID=A0A4U3KRK6_9BACT|nr:GNAT family N-acetyltransferase [Ilyomonas limi]TKK64930.1 GNAT family N-acetyltransferase [Ilyomonas limi]
MKASYTYHDGLQTDRLITRFLTPQDIPLWAAFFKDKEAIEFLSTFGFNSNLNMSTYWIEKQLLRYKENRYGLQALIHKKTKAFIGQCGLITQEIDGILEVEVGYHIIKKYWGQGYAPEAARCFIDYAFTNNIASSVISVIDINNTKSQRVAAKNGLVKEKQTTWAYHNVYVYRIGKEQWQCKKQH